MADRTFAVELVTPEREVFAKQAEFVVVPGTEGQLGILPMHAPIVSGLNIGVIKVVEEGKELFFAVSGGFMEFKNNKMVILANTAEKSDEIDVDRAKAAQERAEQRLASRTEDIDIARAELALKRALNRQKAASLN